MTEPKPAKPNLPAATSQLRNAIARLTEPTTAYLNSHYIEAPGLYHQLHAAVHGQQTNPGGGGGPKSRPPFWTDAMDQLHNIDLIVSVWPTDASGSTLKRLRSLAAKTWTVDDTRAVKRLAGIVNAWADDIETLLDQQNPKYISAPCPACGATTVHHRDTGGDMIREPALKIVTNQGCTCQACRHIWTPDLYLHLCQVLGFELPQGVLA